MTAGAAAAAALTPGPAARLGQALALICVAAAAVTVAAGLWRAAGPAGLAAALVPPAACLAGALATLGGLSAGLVLLPVALLLTELDLVGLGPATLGATVTVAAVPAFAGGLAARWLRCRAEGRLALDRERLALVVAVAATLLPVAILSAAARDLPDRALTAVFAIAGLVAATLVFVLVVAATGPVAAPATPARLERFDWRMVVVIGVVGGYVAGHVPFGPPELVLVYLIMRGFPARMAVGAALAVGLVSTLAVLPTALIRDGIDFPLAFAIVPAAFSGSFSAGWWHGRLESTRAAKALALMAVAANLGTIVLALR